MGLRVALSGILLMSDIAVAGEISHLATFRGLGGVLKEIVGPGPQPGSERLYQSYIYSGSPFEIVSIDPETGRHRVHETPVRSEEGAWAMVIGPDGNLYIGTLPNAHLLRLEPRTGTVTDLGRPSPGEQYIWELTLGPDGKIYGATYPSAKLIRFDPATGTASNLGRMDPQEQYARSIAASDDGFIYLGIGSAKSHLVAYELATGRHRDLLPPELQVPGFAWVSREEDGKIYGSMGTHYFRVQGWDLKPVPQSAVPRSPAARLRDGRVVEVELGRVRVRHPRKTAVAELPFTYAGREMEIFRLGIGPDGQLYGSTALPLHLFRVDQRNGGLTTLGRLGGGEVYSFLSRGSRLLMATYAGLAPLMAYDPARPFSPGTERSSNPRFVRYNGQDDGWRPTTMIHGPRDKVYIGSQAGYGRLDGALTIWDPESDQVESFPGVVQDQGVASLAVSHGLVVGGTTTFGGGGVRPAQTSAKIFVWDPNLKRKTFETIPVPGAREINNLLVGPSGQVYGIADGGKLVIFEPRTSHVLSVTQLPVQSVIYNSVGRGPDGAVWGLDAEGIFGLDLATKRARIVARPPAKITAGGAFDGRALYCASGPRVYRFALPTN